LTFPKNSLYYWVIPKQDLTIPMSEFFASLLISLSLMAMMMAMVMRRRIQQAALARRRIE